MAFQVCVKDEYGQTANVADGRFESAPEAVEFAKKAVTEDNMNNALTLDEKKRNWTSCYIELLDADGNLDESVVYSGKGPGALDMVCMIKESSVEQARLSLTDAQVKVFIGNVSEAGQGQDCYASDTRAKEINDCNHADLSDKAIYYIRFV